MNFLPRTRCTLLFIAGCATAIASVVATAGSNPSSFAAENAAAMRTMMAAMHIPPSADIDRDFAAMMIAHHQGAIDMAQAELRYGDNEQLRRMAQEIIVEQQQEIVAMRLALGERLPPSAPARTQISAATTPRPTTPVSRVPNPMRNP